MTRSNVQTIKDEWNALSGQEKKEVRGLWGEYALNEEFNSQMGAVRAKDGLDATAFLFDRITIPSSPGKTTEIDSVLVCQQGVFVFEVKSWTGDAVYGERSSEHWYVARNNNSRGVRSSITGNPFLQNDHHVKYLKKLLPSQVAHKAVFEAVLLVDASPFGVKSGNWGGAYIQGLFLHPENVVKNVRNMPLVMSGDRVLEIANLLNKYTYGEFFNE